MGRPEEPAPLLDPNGGRRRTLQWVTLLAKATVVVASLKELAEVWTWCRGRR